MDETLNLRDFLIGRILAYYAVMHVLAKAQPLPEPSATVQLLTGLVVLLGIMILRSRRQRI